MAKEPPYVIDGYPRHANMVSANCRNERIFVTKKVKSPELDNTRRFYPKFNIIHSDEEVLSKNPNMTLINKSISVPIESIDGTEYYGRKDIIMQWNI